MNSAKKTPHLLGRRGRGGEDRDLLPQGEALQPGCATFSRGDRFWKLHFYFGLVFTHHACEQKEGSESRGCCGYVHVSRARRASLRVQLMTLCKVGHVSDGRESRLLPE